MILKKKNKVPSHIIKDARYSCYTLKNTKTRVLLNYHWVVEFHILSVSADIAVWDQTFISVKSN